ncbi:RL14 protein, partial [Acromyrmex charruanus]
MATKAGREETPSPLLPAASAIKLVSIRFIFLSEEVSVKCAPGSKLENDEEEGEGRKLDLIEGGESVRDIIDLAASTSPPFHSPVPPTWDRERNLRRDTIEKSTKMNTDTPAQLAGQIRTKKRYAIVLDFSQEKSRKIPQRTNPRPFQRFVQSGRVAYASDGPYQGKLVTIVDVIDQNRVLVDGPSSGVPRCEMRLNELHLTKFRLRFPFSGSTRVVRKAWNSANINELWKETMWAKKVEAKKKRAELSDFDRFKLRKARQIRNKLRTDAFYRLKKKTKKVKAGDATSKSAKKAEKK